MANILQISPIFVLLLFLKSSTSFIFNGSEIIISNHNDKGVATAGDGGEVYGATYRENDPRQIWIIEESLDRPVYEGRFRIINKQVQYNDLSGPPNNNELYPKPWDVRTPWFANSTETWEIALRGRWCLQSPGFGQRYTVDDCEYDFLARYQLWEFEPVSSSRYY